MSPDEKRTYNREYRRYQRRNPTGNEGNRPRCETPTALLERCPVGHLYQYPNLYVTPEGEPRCRRCFALAGKILPGGAFFGRRPR